MSTDRRTIRLGPGECSNVETGARYFAALAFPGAREDQARQDATTAWVASYLHEANRVDESNEPFADQRLNSFVQLSPDWCRAKLRTTNRRLRDRSNLARALRPWGRDLIQNPHPPVPGIRKFTQRQISLYLNGNDPEHAANFQRRIWRPGRPVIHHLIVNDMLLCQFGGQETEFHSKLADANFVGALIERAKLVEPLIHHDPRFGVAMEELLQLEWVS